ncbi:unnamed protein product, partial [Rotaria sp. Silwood1]
IPLDAKWTQHSITVAGGNGQGSNLNQLERVVGFYIDDDQTLYIADHGNQHIMKWKRDATSGQVVAGGNGIGNKSNQLNYPTDVILDKQTDSLIICDFSNRRIVRWPRHDSRSGETIIFNVECGDLAMDDEGSLYVSDTEKHEVRRWRMGEKNGTVVAGGNGEGNRRDQLDYPFSIVVDQDHSVYVSDWNNHRVMKWMKGAKEGIIVAGGNGKGDALTQLHYPNGLFVDRLNTVYVVDSKNHRIMRWPQGATSGSIIVDGNYRGDQGNELDYLKGLSFDRHGNLYVADFWRHRVQKFSIELSSHN